MPKKPNKPALPPGSDASWISPNGPQALRASGRRGLPGLRQARRQRRGEGDPLHDQAWRQRVDQQAHATEQPHRGRRVHVARHPYRGRVERALEQHVTVIVLLEALQSQLLHQPVQLVLLAGPEPGGAEVETVGLLRRAGCLGVLRSTCCRHGQDASTQGVAHLDQAPVDALLLQPPGRVQATEATTDDQDVCIPHGCAAHATPGR